MLTSVAIQALWMLLSMATRIVSFSRWDFLVTLPSTRRRGKSYCVTHGPGCEGCMKKYAEEPWGWESWESVWQYLCSCSILRFLRASTKYWSHLFLHFLLRFSLCSSLRRSWSALNMNNCSQKCGHTEGGFTASVKTWCLFQVPLRFLMLGGWDKQTCWTFGEKNMGNTLEGKTWEYQCLSLLVDQGVTFYRPHVCRMLDKW